MREEFEVERSRWVTEQQGITGYGGDRGEDNQQVGTFVMVVVVVMVMDN